MQTVHDMLGRPAGIAPIAKPAGLSHQTIYRIKDDPPVLKMAELEVVKGVIGYTEMPV